MRSMTIVACLVQVLLLQVSGQVYYKKFVLTADNKCDILNDSQILKYADLADDNEVKVVQNVGSISVFGANITPKNDEVFETYSKSKEASQNHLKVTCSGRIIIPAKIAGNSRVKNEVRKIVYSGDSANRIDVVFMGDGYTDKQRDRFFEDVTRLTNDMFKGDTFKSWLPLFNIWAIHVPSTESGIGYNSAKNTPFKLHREKGQLRAIYPGDPSAARSACKLTGANACDYPSLLANDNFYGGLGGEFVISTRSERTGTIVLRHEMGHNFVKVGEEYDNGQVYEGVNSASSLNSVGWKNWLSGPLREEKAIKRLLEYPWHDLSQGDKSFKFTFTSDGKYSRYYLKVSVTGAGEENSLEFLLDGKVLQWKTRGSDDREFYVWEGKTGFSKDKHTLTVSSKTTSTNKKIPLMIASVTLYEYGNESEFNAANDNYSAYPTWDIDGNKKYRPTNEGCLMRDMTSTHFCNVCKEGMWHQFLIKISLIDGVNVSEDKNQATVSTLKLGQLRPDEQKIPDEKLEIRWFKANQLQSNLNDQFTVPVSKGQWKVEVKLVTPEVKSDPKNHLTDTKAFTV